MNCCSQELARKERERQKKEEKEKEREKERERERQKKEEREKEREKEREREREKKEEREREREKERQKKEEKGKKKRLSSSKEERQIPRSPSGGAAVGPVPTSMKMKPNPSLGAMSHPYGEISGVWLCGGERECDCVHGGGKGSTAMCRSFSVYYYCRCSSSAGVSPACLWQGSLSHSCTRCPLWPTRSVNDKSLKT